MSKQLARHEILTTVWFSRLQIARNQQKKKNDVFMQHIFIVDENFLFLSENGGQEEINLAQLFGC